MVSGPAMPSESFWAITSFFNPAGYQSRIENYHAFRSRLHVPLLAVELSFDDRFTLTDADADVLISVAGRDVMWQKERLLNLALKALPDHVTKVAWLDCDVVFANPDWASEAEDLLERATLIHLFENVIELGPADSRCINSARQSEPIFRGQSAVAAWRNGQVDVGIFGRNQRLEGLHSGLAWAARRETLAPTGFYDACILGSGNRVMACAALGLFDEANRYLQMNSHQAEHFRSWGERHAELVDGEIATLGGTVYHLWHGSLQNRRYGQRHVDLAGYAFDPKTDIATSRFGCWEWNSDKPDMHRYVMRYFESRNEDASSAT